MDSIIGSQTEGCLALRYSPSDWRWALITLAAACAPSIARSGLSDGSGREIGGAYRGHKAVSPKPLGADIDRNCIADKAIAGWGDSQLTNAGGWQVVTKLVAGRLGWRAYDGGVASQTSADVAARQGGSPAKITVLNNTIPTVGSTPVLYRTANPISAFSPSQSARFFTANGIALILSRASNGQYSVAREALGKPIAWPPATAIIPDSDKYRDWTTLIRVGRNDRGSPGSIVGNTAKIVNWLASRCGHYVVLGQIYGPDNGTTNGRRIDDLLRREFPGHFLSTMPALIASSNRSPQDQADVDAGLVPTSLRSDRVSHLNNTGKGIEAAVIARFITAKGWNTP